MRRLDALKRHRGFCGEAEPVTNKGEHGEGFGEYPGNLLLE